MTARVPMIAAASGNPATRIAVTHKGERINPATLAPL
jgi:hypothetical protein